MFSRLVSRLAAVCMAAALLTVSAVSVAQAVNKVTVNVAYTVVSFPPGTAPVDHLLLTLTGANPANVFTATALPNAATVVINGVTPDTYAVKLQALDASNNVLAQKTDTVTVSPPPPVSLSVPGSISTVFTP